MDCLFTEKETKAMNMYINEIRAKGYQPIVYVSPDYDFVDAGIMKMAGAPASPTKGKPIEFNMEQGFIGVYTGVPIFVFDGLDSHTCCVMPQNDHIPFSV